MASYTDESPCGWNLPSTSPTVAAHLIYPLSHVFPALYIAYSILLCTGFSPSLTSGIALSSIISFAYFPNLSPIISSNA